jgi:hypothetical protein
MTPTEETAFIALWAQGLWMAASHVREVHRRAEPLMTSLRDLTGLMPHAALLTIPCLMAG